MKNAGFEEGVGVISAAFAKIPWIRSGRTRPNTRNGWLL